jgi:hypothetical protein
MVSIKVKFAIVIYYNFGVSYMQHTTSKQIPITCSLNPTQENAFKINN